MLNFSLLTTYQKVNFVFLFLQAFVGLVGITSNLVTICVFSRKRLRNHSYSFYCRLMAIIDIIYLSHSFRHLLAFVFNASFDLAASFLCVLNEYTEYVTSQTSLWLLTLISADRLFSIVFPNRFKITKNRLFQFSLFLIILIYSVSIYISLPLNARLINLTNRTNLTSSLVSSPQANSMCFFSMNVRKTNSIIVLVNLVLVNLFVNNFLNARIVMFIYWSRKIVSSELIHVKKTSTLVDRRFAISSVGLNLCSLVLKMPYAVGCLICYYFSSSFGADLVQAVLTITITLNMIQNGSAFFVNMFTNSLFYSEFFSMIGLRKPILTITDSNILTRQKIIDSNV